MVKLKRFMLAAGIFFGLVFVLSFIGSSSPASGAGYVVPPQATSTPSGPHGDYISTSQKCEECHAVHRAESPFRLMRYQTVLQNCGYCHDPTFGITTPTVSERAMVMEVIPSSYRLGGHFREPKEVTVSPSLALEVGITSDTTFTLTCSSCHSPHANPSITLPGEGWFQGDEDTTRSSHLLLCNPGSSTGSYHVYGGGWCADCHERRHNGIPSVYNHPVNTATALTAVWYWNTSTLSWSTMSLANSNQGFFQYATSGVPPTNYPICQQCHEDSRDVETSYTSGANPYYVAFPHETENRRMVIETGDDICLNCHVTSELP